VVSTCNLTKPGDAGCLAKANATCTTKLGKVALDAAKVAPAVDKRCGARAIDFDPLRQPTGANLDALASLCADYGVSALDSIAAFETCLVRQHTCRAEELGRFEIPRAGDLLGMLSPPASLHSDFCPASP
jgi:hypothetical protein